jgi:pyruvate dehydrogenase E2 component (dihydrolipoamide acetyltransferase)
VTDNLTSIQKGDFNMNVLKLPAFGMSARRGTIIKWYKKEGDTVCAKEPLYDMESEKSSFTVDAPYDIVLRKIIINEGQVDVGAPVAIVSLPGEDFNQQELDSLLAEILNKAKPSDASDAKPQPAGTIAQSAKADKGKARATPVARKLAADLGVDLSEVPGSGPNGLITDKDVRSFAQKAKQEGNYELVKLSGFARVSAEHLTRSWQTIPHIIQHMEMDATSLVNARNELKKSMKVSYNDLLAKLVPIALKKHPKLNATMEKELEIKLWKDINLSIAIETDLGLTVPVIKNADQKSLEEIHNEILSLAEKAKMNKLFPDDISNGTFTLSNLGAYGAGIGNPIINAPQVALLYIGAIKEKPWVVDGKLAIAPVISMSLACDHRAVDGAVAARFGIDLREVVENAEKYLL